MVQVQSISIIGSGNLAYHLARAFFNAGIEINQILSRTLTHAQALAKTINADYTNVVGNIHKKSDLYILAISDDKIEEISKEFSKHLDREKIITHTSGIKSTDCFQPFFKNYGVIYPFQTFSKGREVDMKMVPFCIFGNSDPVKKILIDLSKMVSDHVFEISNEQRQHLHLAAVFANNFSNHMCVLAEKICKHQNLDFNLLLPLINETSKKLMTLSPQDAQTGPAKRGDLKTLFTHRKMLADNPELLRLYNLCTRGIEEKLD